MNVHQLRAFDLPDLAHSAPGEQPRPRAEIALLIAEANHRICNLLAMVEAIVRQTRSDTVEEYRTNVAASPMRGGSRIWRGGRSPEPPSRNAGR
jgi:hypothetical protein